MSEKFVDHSQPPTDTSTVSEGFSFLSDSRKEKFSGSCSKPSTMRPLAILAKA